MINLKTSNNKTTTTSSIHKPVVDTTRNLAIANRSRVEGIYSNSVTLKSRP